MIWSLLNFYNLSSSSAANDPAVGAACTSARNNLKAMGNNFLNASDLSATSVRYGKAMFKTHDALKKLMSQP
jgi:hypothetical protein